MKPRYLSGLPVLFSALLLAGCHDDSGADQTVDQNPAQANVLHIKGEGVDRQVVLDPKEVSVSFSATGNLPMDTICFSEPSKNPAFLSGYINLLPDSMQINLSSLIFAEDPKANDVNDITFLNCFNHICIDHTQYTLQKGPSVSTLSLAFKQTPHRFYTYDPVVKDFTKQTPVQLSGVLQYSIPNHWPVLQKKRFPYIAVQGQARFDGKSYRVSSVKALPNITSIEGKEYQREYEMTLKQGSTALSLSLRVDNPEVQQQDAAIYVSVIDDSGYYQAKLPFPQTYWVEDAAELKVQFNNMVLVENDSHASKVLDISLEIPKARLQATLDSQPLQLYAGYDGRAYNDQKRYDISLGDSKALQSLQLVQELKGHLSLKYQENGQDYSCGSPDLACTGMTVDADQRTYRFNHVKLGNKVLDGTMYIPGVFE